MKHTCCCTCEDCKNGKHCLKWSVDEFGDIMGCGEECDCGDYCCSNRHTFKQTYYEDLSCYTYDDEDDDDGKG